MGFQLVRSCQSAGQCRKYPNNHGIFKDSFSFCCFGVRLVDDHCSIGPHNNCTRRSQEVYLLSADDPAESATDPAETSTDPNESTTDPNESTTDPNKSTTDPNEPTTTPAPGAASSLTSTCQVLFLTIVISILL